MKIKEHGKNPSKSYRKMKHLRVKLLFLSLLLMPSLAADEEVIIMPPHLKNKNSTVDAYYKKDAKNYIGVCITKFTENTTIYGR